MELYRYTVRYHFTLAGEPQEATFMLIHTEKIDQRSMERLGKEALLAGTATLPAFLDFLVKEHGFIRPAAGAVDVVSDHIFESVRKNVAK